MSDDMKLPAGHLLFVSDREVVDHDPFDQCPVVGGLGIFTELLQGGPAVVGVEAHPERLLDLRVRVRQEFLDVRLELIGCVVDHLHGGVGARQDLKDRSERVVDVGLGALADVDRVRSLLFVRQLLVVPQQKVAEELVHAAVHDQERSPPTGTAEALGGPEQDTEGGSGDDHAEHGDRKHEHESDVRVSEEPCDPERDDQDCSPADASEEEHDQARVLRRLTLFFGLAHRAPEAHDESCQTADNRPGQEEE